ncbi:MAG: MBL fold metallo-hydrolase, partial [Nitrospiria bacterium]
PNAKYYLQRREWESAIHPNERTKGSYRQEDFIILQEMGLIEFLEGDAKILEGIGIMETPGHTSHHQSPLIESEGKKALFLGDLIPTTSHIPYPYIMGYDLFPLTTLATKKKILARAYEEHWLLIFQHDPKVRMGYLKEIKGQFGVDEMEEET